MALLCSSMAHLQVHISGLLCTLGRCARWSAGASLLAARARAAAAGQVAVQPRRKAAQKRARTWAWGDAYPVLRAAVLAQCSAATSLTHAACPPGPASPPVLQSGAGSGSSARTRFLSYPRRRVLSLLCPARALRSWYNAFFLF